MIENTKRAAGFTLVELLVVIGIIALLISILLPTLAKARDAAYTTKCMATLHSLGEEFAAYQSAYGGSYPPGYYLSSATISLSGDPNQITDGANGQQYVWWSIIRGFTRKNSIYDNSTAGIGSGSTITRFMENFNCPLGHNVSAGCDFGANPIVMPDLEQQAFYTTGKSIQGFTPAKISGVYPDNVVLWDATEIPPDYATQYAVGYQVDFNSGIALNNMGNPNSPAHNFRDIGHYFDSKKTLSDGNPVYIYTDTVSSSSPPPQFAENITSSTNARAQGVPCWRHAGNTACNFLFADGSVKTLSVKWSGTAWVSELIRRQLRIKWPAGIVDLDKTS